MSLDSEKSLQEVLSATVIGELAGLAKRVGNQKSKRALRAIATREISDLFADCGIVSVRHSEVKSRIEQFGLTSDTNLICHHDVMREDTYNQDNGVSYTKLEVVRNVKNRLGTSLLDTKKFVESWAAKFGHTFAY